MGLTVPVRQLALRVGMVDHPGPRKVHAQPMPLLGGLAIYLGVLVALLVSLGGPALTQVIGIYAGATLVAAVGILDDRGLLHHQIKLFGAMPAAAVILLVSGIRAQVFSNIWPGAPGVWLDTALTSGVGRGNHRILQHLGSHGRAVRWRRRHGFALLRHLRLESGQLLVSTMAAAVLGAAAGFLRWNFKPAKIFMGDGGAMFLGFLMATLSLKLRPVLAGSPQRRVANPDSYSRRNHLRHHADFHFPFAPRLPSIHNARKRPHRASPLECFREPAHRSPADVRARRFLRPAGVAHQPPARRAGLHDCCAHSRGRARRSRFTRTRALRTPDPQELRIPKHPALFCSRSYGN